MSMEKDIHRVEIVTAKREGGYDTLASEEFQGSLRQAKKRCGQMAKEVFAPGNKFSVSRSRGIVYLPDGSRHREALNLDLLMWEDIG